MFELGGDMVAFMRKVFRRLFPRPAPLYKIGNVKFHNTLVDTLTPNLVEIGDNFVSAPGSIILSHDASTYFHSGKYRVGKTTIGDNVFLGANATVMPGVTIGDNVIVGAGSVVTKDVAANAVVCGNPARFMCTVAEYIDKCEEKGVLVPAPKGFSGIFSNKQITEQDRQELQFIAEEHYKNGR